MLGIKLVDVKVAVSDVHLLCQRFSITETTDCGKDYTPTTRYPQFVYL